MNKAKARKRRSPIDAARVHELIALGYSTRAVSRVLNCTQGRVWQIATGYTMPRRTRGKKTPPVQVMNKAKAAVSDGTASSAATSNDTPKRVRAAQS